MLFIFTSFVLCGIILCQIEFSFLRRDALWSTKQKQARHSSAYVKANYDRLSVNVTKGKKATIQAYASQRGESLNAFINRAIDETIEKEALSKKNNSSTGCFCKTKNAA